MRKSLKNILAIMLIVSMVITPEIAKAYNASMEMIRLTEKVNQSSKNFYQAEKSRETARKNYQDLFDVALKSAGNVSPTGKIKIITDIYKNISKTVDQTPLGPIIKYVINKGRDTGFELAAEEIFQNRKLKGELEKDFATYIQFLLSNGIIKKSDFTAESTRVLMEKTQMINYAVNHLEQSNLTPEQRATLLVSIVQVFNSNLLVHEDSVSLKMSSLFAKINTDQQASFEKLNNALSEASEHNKEIFAEFTPLLKQMLEGQAKDISTLDPKQLAKPDFANESKVEKIRSLEEVRQNVQASISAFRLLALVSGNDKKTEKFIFFAAHTTDAIISAATFFAAPNFASLGSFSDSCAAIIRKAKNVKEPNEIIIEELYNIKNLISTVRLEMHERFDQIENHLYMMENNIINTLDHKFAVLFEQNEQILQKIDKFSYVARATKDDEFQNAIMPFNDLFNDIFHFIDDARTDEKNDFSANDIDHYFHELTNIIDVKSFNYPLNNTLNPFDLGSGSLIKTKQIKNTIVNNNISDAVLMLDNGFEDFLAAIGVDGRNYSYNTGNVNFIEYPAAFFPALSRYFSALSGESLPAVQPDVIAYAMTVADLLYRLGLKKEETDPNFKMNPSSINAIKKEMAVAIQAMQDNIETMRSFKFTQAGKEKTIEKSFFRHLLEIYISQLAQTNNDLKSKINQHINRRFFNLKSDNLIKDLKIERNQLLTYLYILKTDVISHYCFNKNRNILLIHSKNAKHPDLVKRVPEWQQELLSPSLSCIDPYILYKEKMLIVNKAISIIDSILELKDNFTEEDLAKFQSEYPLYVPIIPNKKQESSSIWTENKMPPLVLTEKDLQYLIQDEKIINAIKYYQVSGLGKITGTYRFISGGGVHYSKETSTAGTKVYVADVDTKVEITLRWVEYSGDSQVQQDVETIEEGKERTNDLILTRILLEADSEGQIIPYGFAGIEGRETTSGVIAKTGPFPLNGYDGWRSGPSFLMLDFPGIVMRTKHDNHSLATLSKRLNVLKKGYSNFDEYFVSELVSVIKNTLISHVELDGILTLINTFIHYALYQNASNNHLFSVAKSFLLSSKDIEKRLLRFLQWNNHQASVKQLSDFTTELNARLDQTLTSSKTAVPFLVKPIKIKRKNAPEYYPFFDEVFSETKFAQKSNDQLLQRQTNPAYYSDLYNDDDIQKLMLSKKQFDNIWLPLIKRTNKDE